MCGTKQCQIRPVLFCSGSSLSTATGFTKFLSSYNSNVTPVACRENKAKFQPSPSQVTPGGIGSPSKFIDCLDAFLLALENDHWPDNADDKRDGNEDRSSQRLHADGKLRRVRR